ncbi:hypothetical protein [Actinoplanes sp. NBRC 103695]|uniref:hypothetical protein n=1 Tax=Actinoplanes sp. NBRC 103695 TaxID=3032202 RepID=UPI0024A0AB85|nr:hypothetical protein [Actinoplanes sp. NBRC 103695]GLY95749.1 hypothetical protein Acsp02_30040 [Actinoplanes sp. NBRC 103695]
MSDPSINVETGELNNFAKDVRFEADEVFRPAVSRAAVSLSGINFGQKNASGAVHAAKTRYSQAMSAHVRNLNAYVEAAGIMAAAAELVAKEFDAVDANNAEAAARVNAMLRSATDEAHRKAFEQAYGTGGAV